ncbi:hypothetical protein [Curvivirga aplysinae]|uniref:hypothetical protein n=1 Tax=Curvivirga aplysinae TaxID=2529852 RepID=UPI0012BD60B4|nr:hypothetical protein [Curvivirga aplysinae]MTI08731.1 hypothetical protein [Curvivirga aplysinae]
MAQFQVSNVHHSVTGDNAMTEIALALAMGFFAIMILTLVSMGAGTAEVSQETHESNSFISAALAPAKPDQSENSSVVSKVQQQDQLVIYYHGQFMDAEMKPIVISQIFQDEKSRVILALDPELPMIEAMSIRSKIPTEKLVISALDQSWLTRLSAEFGQK